MARKLRARERKSARFAERTRKVRDEADASKVSPSSDDASSDEEALGRLEFILE